ncbi:MAG: GlxA family transcriptional regulator [Alphaproteobacteria bacterium]
MLVKRIGVLGFDGVTAAHLAAPADAFAAATLHSGYGDRIPCYQTYIIGLGPESFRAESGMVFRPHETLQTAHKLDTIIVPGGKGLREREISDRISDWLLQRAHATRRFAAISTGIYGVAPTGLLDGREVTTHWRFSGDVTQRFPKLRVDHKRPLVKDGAFYTSNSLSAAIDLSLSLIEEDYGSCVALAVAEELGVPVMHRNGQEALSKPLKFDSQPTDRFAELVPWIMRNLNGDLSVNNLARRACMSPSHFSRAFKSIIGSAPAEFVETLRMNEVKRRLSIPKRTLDAVAASVGFSDGQAFRRAFERRFGAKPRSYLKNFDAGVAGIFSNGTVRPSSMEAECLAAGQQ